MLWTRIVQILFISGVSWSVVMTIKIFINERIS